MGYIARKVAVSSENRRAKGRKRKLMMNPSQSVRKRRLPALGLAAGALSACLALAGGAQAGAETVKAGPWRPIFDGRTLDGWTPKIAGHPAGDNYRQTFVVADGAIRVSYAGYERFDGEFGHLFYKTPFKAYRLRLSYRFLDPGVPGTPKWARSNSGVMFHSQSPQSMTLGQSFPVSVEFQILGRDGDAPRPTGAVCTPGVDITFDGVLAKDHCTPPANGPTIPNGTWTQLELDVMPNGEVFQKINGATVHHYAGLTFDAKDTVAPGAQDYLAARGGKPITEGYIALQSEGHPVEFKDIEVQELTAAR